MAGAIGVEASTSSESEKLQKLTQIVLPKFVALLVTEMENKMMVEKEGLKSCHEVGVEEGKQDYLIGKQKLDGTTCYVSVPEIGAALEFCYEEFMSAEGFLTLHQHIYYSPFLCWAELTASTTSYNLSRSKATSLPLALSYIHAILVHTLIGRKESTGVIGTFDTYSL
ncbi:hypothetical protein Goarm_021264 [Gossypium armourianum]|uniref:Uncharacterized protein n=1 Tax=Gossypium armourianum TaxID=34283 RepID=A0A7J9IS39_9ROSI|nr:hypothetical protein [Gossypium armourianum]